MWARILQLKLNQDLKQSLFDWNQTKTEYPRDQTVHELFVQQVDIAPGSIAIEHEGETLSYAELNQRANQVAHYLISRGVGEEVIVGVCIDRSPDLVIAQLGVLKAGAAYLPIDPDYPGKRLAFILDDARAPVLITHENLKQKMGDYNGHILSLNSDQSRVRDESTEDPEVRVGASHLAYVIYTSGSTGEPKGVEVTHGGLANLVAWHRRVYQVTAADHASHLAGLGFDASVWELWPYLASGATVHLIPEIDRLSPARLWTWMVEQEITLSFMPTPLAEAALQVKIPGKLALRALLTGGDRLHDKLIDQVMPFKVVNHYGPTENTVVATCAEVDLHAAGDPPIGKPIDNVQTYILDEQMQAMPVGVAGELYIGGDSLARGYLGRPELTQQKFVANPFSDIPGSKLYRTGDRVRYRPDGNIEFLGRFDHQVKLRGFRIELGEIESVLRKHEAVRNSVAMLHEDEPGDQRLTAYLVPEPEWLQENARSHVKSHVQEWRSLYQQAYQSTPENQDPAFNITGWDSSYTGDPIPAEQMREWVDSTVARIHDLQPSRVLEIGFGTGLLLCRLAPDCERYVGVDFSAEALDKVERLIQGDSSLQHVELIQAAANNLQELKDGDFDTIIINSVVQYFPNLDYLLGVLRSAVQFLQPGGSIFVGDLRNYSLLTAFHSLVQMFQASDKSSGEALLDRIQRHLKQEHELAIAPGFFDALPALVPEITAVEVQLRRGHYRNELNQFRYDVTLATQGYQAQIDDSDCYDWRQQDLTLEKLRDMLQQSEA